jgi:hypothetical protein
MAKVLGHYEEFDGSITFTVRPESNQERQTLRQAWQRSAGEQTYGALLHALALDLLASGREVVIY